MEKLELKHLAPYLPYGVKVRSRQETTYILNIFSNMRGEGLESRDIYSCLDNQYKPILRPLSDLTKEIEHNGDRFVPSKALSCWDLDGISLIDIPHIPVNLYELFLKWHFDVFGLIDKGLAIDINSI